MLTLLFPNSRHRDEWAGTIVCRRSEVAPQSLRSSGIFVMVFMLAAMADGALIISGLLVKYPGYSVIAKT